MNPTLFQTPSNIVLMAVKRTLEAYDWIGAGFDAAPHIRHARRRFTDPDEWPCITIRWEQDEPRTADQDDNYASSGEMYVDMRLTLEIETPSVESDGEDNPDEDPLDETGMGFSTAMAFAALRALKDQDGELRRLWVNDVSDRGRGEDPDSTPDLSRFEQSVIVLYRVSTEDPSVLLAEGMNP